MVYLPTWMVDFYDKCRWIYILYGKCRYMYHTWILGYMYFDFVTKIIFPQQNCPGNAWQCWFFIFSSSDKRTSAGLPMLVILSIIDKISSILDWKSDSCLLPRSRSVLQFLFILLTYWLMVQKSGDHHLTSRKKTVNNGRLSISTGLQDFFHQQYV